MWAQKKCQLGDITRDASTDTSTVGGSDSGGCTQKTNPYLGFKFSENSSLNLDEDCDGIYWWFPTKVIKMVTSYDGTRIKKLIERSLDLNSREAILMAHENDDPSSPIKQAKVWRYNAAGTLVTTKSYDGDPETSPVIESSQIAYDAKGNELNSRNYEGDFEKEGTVRRSTVNTFTSDGEYLSMKYFN